LYWGPAGTSVGRFEKCIGVANNIAGIVIREADGIQILIDARIQVSPGVPAIGGSQECSSLSGKKPSRCIFKINGEKDVPGRFRIRPFPCRLGDR